jgi:hypothetical protein
LQQCPRPLGVLAQRADAALRRAHRAVVVAVTTVRMMSVARDQVVDVVAVRHGLVSAAGPVSVSLGVARAAVCGCAARGVCGADVENTFVDVTVMVVMKVAVVKVVDVVTVLDDGWPQPDPWT